MVIGSPDVSVTAPNAVANAAGNGGVGANSLAHPSGIPQDKIDNIMSGIANTGDVKMNNHRKKLRQRFDIIKKLGQGTYGKVQLGINKETGQEVAIKTIKKCKIEAEADLVRIRREVQIMSSVQHPNIIHIYEVFENREKMVLVMEFAAGGELYDYLSERKVLNEEEARRIFRQVATAVYYCHKHKICHRDLKLENILLDEHGNAKIADFGLSNVFDDQRLLATFCGSPLYASPEIVEGTPYQGPEVDCWSLGVLLYTLVYGSMPFDGSNFKRLVKQISQGDYYEPKKPSRASSLIRDMLTVCPRKRATIEQICSHWWVNENDNISCLDLAEDLANQTPVRLDVLLSLTPAAITADQLVVPSAEGIASAKAGERVPRSHSVGSIRDIGANTEAERRILDMVAAGGEAALMPSPTRTITPAQSPVQSKRKLQTTVSMENAAGAVKKKEKPGSSALLAAEPAMPMCEEDAMEIEAPAEQVQSARQSEAPAAKEPALKSPASASFSKGDMKLVGDICEKLIHSSNGMPVANSSPSDSATSTAVGAANQPRPKVANKLDAVEEALDEKDPTKVIKKFVSKHKTADLVNAIGQIVPNEPSSGAVAASSQPHAAAAPATGTSSAPPFVRKCSLQDESSLNKFGTERRKSRILETAEKFQQMNAGSTADKPKKLVIPGVSVGSYKKEFERKATAATPAPGPTAGELRAMEQVAAAAAAAKECEAVSDNAAIAAVESSDSKNSVASLTLDDARRSMENSIALLRQAQSESSTDVDQLCAQTENIGVSDNDRERKLKNARAIIGNAIQPASPGGDPSPVVKTSTASITLKSATLPRRKATGKTGIQIDIKPHIVEQPSMRFTTEMQHPVPDLRSAPPRDTPAPYSPIKAPLSGRATSLEPKEHIIPIQRPQTAYARTTSNTTTARSGSLSRQSTLDSESDTTTTNMSQSTITGTGSSQPIKKSPREFIIPIAVEGGGFITPREGSIEPSESSHTTSSRSTFSRLRPTRRIGSILNDSGVDEGSPFQKMRTGSMNKDGDDDPRFTLHRLRSSRPVKKISQDNDSQSSGEEDDDDGFEILTAENLFSTLLQRVRALTNRLNVNNDLTTGFPNSSRLLSNMRQGQGPFWNQEPFGSRINSSASNVGAPWRHSLSRDLGSDMESMFSRTGATLPRGMNTSAKANRIATEITDSPSANGTDEETIENIRSAAIEEPLDLADLDLSRLRLSKQDLETLSSIAPGLPKCFQEQLLAKLPPTQARKLSRTLSVQASPQRSSVKVYKRSQSGGRDSIPEPSDAGLATKCDLSERCSNSLISRRNASHSHCDYDPGTPSSTSETEAARLKSGTNSVCREDDCGKSLCSPLVGDINERYKYYSPYLTKSGKDMTYTDSGSVLPQKRYGCVSPRESTTTALGRPPSGYLSPPPNINTDCGSGSLRRRYISRFLRPDFFDNAAEESPYQREKKMRERETQSVLREIREKPRESSRERILSNRSPSSEGLDVAKEARSQHGRNKSIGGYSDCLSGDLSATNNAKHHRRSLSRPPDLGEEMNKHQLADKILQELQLLSAVRSQQDKSISVPKEEIPLKSAEVQFTATAKSQGEEGSCLDSTSTIKRIKKMKAKENSTESKTDVNGKIPTTILKKVRKIVKNGEITKTPPLNDIAADAANTDECQRVLSASVEQKKESKLKRPKSYPTKDYVPGSVIKTDPPCPVFSSKVSSKPTPISEGSPESNGFILSETKSTTAGGASRESRLIRPKSYPATKLTPPKEVKKIVRSGIAIPILTQAGATLSCSVSRQSTSEEKSLSATPTGRGSFDTSSSSSESRPATIKKVVKVTKKSKLAQPMSVTALTTIADANCKESNPQQLKDKSPEKKPHKGLLYAIGQKFEKLRDSAMNKDKKATGSNSTVKNCAPSKVTTPNSEPLEEPKKKSTLHMKKKTSDNALINTDKTPCATPIETSVKIPRTSRAPTKTSEMEKTVRSEKRSRIDAMIRSLRERSIPRSHATTESNYIKRAVSVEEIPGRFNRNAVTRVMGLFKRFEKDGNERRVRSTRSTSNIERHIRDSSPSPIYSNITATKCALTAGTISTIANNGHNDAPNCICHVPSSTKQNVSCPECIEIQPAPPVAKRHEEKVKVDHENGFKDSGQGNRDKRKGLMLDFNKLEKLDCNQAPINQKPKTNYNNTTYSNLHPYPGAVNHPSNNSSSQQSMDNAINNNNTSLTNNNSLSMQTSQTSGYHTSSAHEINRNHLLTPSSDNIANYSSDSRSYQDDCASTSTFLSPTDEPELYFDNWSICSEDNYMLHATPSPTVSRLSRASQLSSPTRGGDGSDPNESVIDRIKRRSFYCRFNEKKPRRTSSIVGPSAVRDYYREQQNSCKARSSNKLNTTTTNANASLAGNERDASPDITQQFFRPLKLSPVGTELKPPVYKSSFDHQTSSVTGSKPRKSLNDIRPTISPSYLSKRYSSMAGHDYLSTVPTRFKSSSSSSPYDSTCGSGAVGSTTYYSTYNPKRRSSYTLNGGLASGSNISNSNIDGFATVGRRSARAYDHRTMSLLDSPTTSSYCRDARTPVRDYTSNVSRSNSRYRASSTSRSPTNI